jgi:hypothetical protein
LSKNNKISVVQHVLSEFDSRVKSEVRESIKPVSKLY